MNFSFPTPLIAPLVAGLAIPLFLAMATRIASLSGRNPVQFLVAVLASYAAWGLMVVAIPAWRPEGALSGLAGVMCIAGCALFYLEVWGLMSRGYTLGVMLTLYLSGRAMTLEELALAYRGGDGLDWIVDHRLTGLAASGIADRRGGQIYLTRPKGTLVAALYILAIQILGLKKTG